MVKILGIETSCDDTAVAVVSDDKRILVNEVVSQDKEHTIYGGVVPEIASRFHLSNLDPLVNKVKTRVALSDIDAIAVTKGPGLVGSLLVGVMYAKALAAALNKPIIGVDHLEGHALTARLTSDISYPYLLLLVSGGHSQFMLIRGLGDYVKLGDTLDDAVGEAFDKVAKMLGLGYPGGPAIEKLARLGNQHAFKFPKPLARTGDCNFSFSGLKTAVKYKLNKISSLSPALVQDVAASFQFTVGETLKLKLINAFKLYEFSERQFVIAGGVASNSYLRRVLSQTCALHGFSFYAPPASLCCDNAAMIAWAGVERFKAGLVDTLGFGIYARSML